MTHPYRRYRFAQALAGTALWSALLSVSSPAHGALDASVDRSPGTGHRIAASDASNIESFMRSRELIDFSGVLGLANPSSFSHPESPSGIALDLDTAVFVNRGLRLTRDFSEFRNDPGIVGTRTVATAATQSIPEPTEYMLLAGGLLILWAVLRWKSRARRSRLKR